MKVDALQKDIGIQYGQVWGKLFYQSSYKNFSSNPAEQKGHYLVLDLTSDEGAKIETAIGTSEELGSKQHVVVNDGFCVYLVKDPTTQLIHIKTSKDSDKVNEVTLDLSNLELIK